MKTLIRLVILMALTLATAVAFAATPDAAPAAPTFLGWFTANENGLLKFALALSEFLALFKVFQGNGILDTIIKGLKALYEAKSGERG